MTTRGGVSPSRPGGGPDCRDGVPCFAAIDGDARHWMATLNRLPIVSIHYVRPMRMRCFCAAGSRSNAGSARA